MQTIVNLGTGGADLNGQNGSTASADSNDALFLDWPGDNGGNYVYLPGVASNYLSVPDEAALDITGDIDIRVRVALDDWTPGALSRLLSKRQTSAQISYDIYLNTTGTVGFSWSEDGATAKIKTSNASVPFADGAAGWVRVTMDVDNGSSDADVKFWTSDDGASWTQLGTTQSVGATTSIYAGTNSLFIGVRGNTSSDPAAGKFYRAQVLDGIDGTTVLDVDCSQITSGSDTSFTALTGQTVTINRSTSGRKSVAVVSPVWLFGTDDYMEVADNALLDFGATDDFTVILAVRQWSNFATSRGLVTKRSATTGSEPGWLLRSGASNGALMVAGVSDASNLAQTQSSGALSSGVFSLVSLRRDISADTVGVGVDGSFASATDTTTATSTNALPLRIGRLSGAGTNYADMEVVAAAVFRRALTSGELTTLSNYFAGRVA